MLKFILKCIFALFLIVASYVSINIVASEYGYVYPWNVSEVFEITQSWGGLAEFPADSDITSVKDLGGMFTRILDIEFTATSHSLEQWIDNSKRLKENTPENLGNEIYKYYIYPGENGAQGGWVEIDKLNSHVKIHIYWS